MGVNIKKPEWVLIYEWLGLVLISGIGIIIGTMLGSAGEYILQQRGITGIRLVLPMCLIIVFSICKWKSRHIALLVKARTIFTVMQFVAFGYFLAGLSTVFITIPEIYMVLIGGAITIITLLLVKANVIVHSIVRSGLLGTAVGIIAAGILKYAY